jgi:phosphate starvation-inducible PhoH-like protein
MLDMAQVAQLKSLNASFTSMERIFPKSLGQRAYHALLSDPRVSIVAVCGPAGSGKTYMASLVGSQMFKNIIVTRPAVSVDEQHGYLPGTIESKMEPWVRPVFDSLKVSKKKPTIEICPLAYMRGRTFDNSWIIADEMQNSTPNQMKMIMTRLGQNSKLVITGDVTQCEQGFSGTNGLQDLKRRLEKFDSDSIKLIELSDSDIQRSEIIKSVLRLYT